MWCHVECPIDCQVSPWSAWDDSECAPCGHRSGKKTFFVTASSPPHLFLSATTQNDHFSSSFRREMGIYCTAGRFSLTHSISSLAEYDRFTFPPPRDSNDQQPVWPQLPDDTSPTASLPVPSLLRMAAIKLD